MKLINSDKVYQVLSHWLSLIKLTKLNKDYQALVSYYKTISKSDSCMMIFTNEVAIPYLLKKKTCSKYYLMYTATPKEIQNNLKSAA